VTASSFFAARLLPTAAVSYLNHSDFTRSYSENTKWTVFLVGMCNLASVLCRLLKAYDGIIYNINGTFWLMVVWADNPIEEALVEHGYSFARLQSFGGHWLLVYSGFLICLVMILLLGLLEAVSAASICLLNCCCICLCDAGPSNTDFRYRGGSYDYAQVSWLVAVLMTFF
jgi:hypothetical protein